MSYTITEELVIIDGNAFKPVDNVGCGGCALYKKGPRHICFKAKCTPAHRADERNVSWVKAEKIKNPNQTPHVHAELIKAWADGAEIEVYDSFEKRWVDSDMTWNPKMRYRIKHPIAKPDKVYEFTVEFM